MDARTPWVVFRGCRGVVSAEAENTTSCEDRQTLSAPGEGRQPFSGQKFLLFFNNKLLAMSEDVAVGLGGRL
jgi:hypothetical protein